MKTIRIRRGTFLIKLVLIFCFLFEYNLFYLVKLPESLNFILIENRSKRIAPLAVMIAIYYWRKSSDRQLRGANEFLYKYLILVSLSVLLMWIYATIKYPLNPLITTYGFGCYYFYAFLSVPIIYIFTKEEGMDTFLKIVNVFSLVMLILSTLQGIYFLKTGNFMFALSGTEYSWLRGGKARLNTGQFAYIMVIYNTYRIFFKRIFTNKSRMFSYLYLAVTLLNIIFTGQSRVILFVMISSILLIVWNTNGSSKKFVILSAIGMLLVVGLYNNIFSSILNSFSLNGTEAGSTIARLGAFRYYLSEYLKNPIFGIGFAGDVNYYNLVHGDSGTYFQSVLVRYYYSDVGIIGLIAQTGIFAIPIYIYPLIRYVKSLKQIKRNKVTNEYYPLVLALAWYLFATSFTYSILEEGTVIGFPIIIAMLEFVISKAKPKSLTDK